MDTNGMKEPRSNGSSFGVFVLVFFAQNVVSMLLFGTYSTGILPLIECGVLSYLWKTNKLGPVGIALIALVCSIVFSLVGIWAYQTRYGA